MNLAATICLYGRGTPEGARKGWDKRGRGRKEQVKPAEEPKKPSGDDEITRSGWFTTDGKFHPLQLHPAEGAKEREEHWEAAVRLGLPGAAGPEAGNDLWDTLRNVEEKAGAVRVVNGSDSYKYDDPHEFGLEGWTRSGLKDAVAALPFDASQITLDWHDPKPGSEVFTGKEEALERMAASRDVRAYGTSEGVRKGWETRRAGGTSPEQGFVSPNVREGTALDDAVKALHTPEQQQFVQEAKDLLSKMGETGTVAGAIGSWKHGAENSIAIGSKASPEENRYLVAKMGLSRNQKGVITFHAQDSGSDTMWRIIVPKNYTLKNISDTLDRHGINDRSLIPRKDGTEIRLIDFGSSMLGSVKGVAKEYGTHYQRKTGSAEFMGGNTREEGAAAFRGIIEKYEKGIRASGNSMGRGRDLFCNYRWGASTEEIAANRKLHYRTDFQGLPISIENRKGSIRRGEDDGGHGWATKMHVPYGYIRGTTSTDGDGLDVFLGPNRNSRMVYVIHINRPPDFKSYDEDKIFLGFQGAASAKACFMRHYDNPKFYGGMDAFTISEFKKRIRKKTGKPEKLVGAQLEADAGEPNVYPGGYAHIEPRMKFRPPSLKNVKPVPVDDPMETDDRFGDVTRRRSAETIGFRDRLTKKKGSDEKYIGIRTTQVSGFPAVGIGGFG